ncbi:MAG: hypothetical protein NW200_03915 [Hyphomonadaceae bacterium]|nr:hypothetical protein [Hyphomonadaceae bacterium]
MSLHEEDLRLLRLVRATRARRDGWAPPPCNVTLLQLAALRRAGLLEILGEGAVHVRLTAQGLAALAAGPLR